MIDSPNVDTWIEDSLKAGEPAAIRAARQITEELGESRIAQVIRESGVDIGVEGE